VRDFFWTLFAPKTSQRAYRLLTLPPSSIEEERKFRSVDGAEALRAHAEHIPSSMTFTLPKSVSPGPSLEPASFVSC
jgi:hypothetical protein